MYGVVGVRVDSYKVLCDTPAAYRQERREKNWHLRKENYQVNKHPLLQDEICVWGQWG